jgi:hypothetical protein
LSLRTGLIILPSLQVKCDAGGSNPEPVMNLFLNDQNPYVSVKTMADTTSEFASYTGTFTVDSLTINAHNAPQALVCKANIPGASYPSVEAGIALMVQIGKFGIFYLSLMAQDKSFHENQHEKNVP